jgi:hypothetical protein
VNDAHRQTLFETRFLSDGPQEFPRPSIWPRVIHFVASATVLIAAGAVLIAWATR